MGRSGEAEAWKVIDVDAEGGKEVIAGFGVWGFSERVCVFLSHHFNSISLFEGKTGLNMQQELLTHKKGKRFNPELQNRPPPPSRHKSCSPAKIHFFDARNGTEISA